MEGRIENVYGVSEFHEMRQLTQRRRRFFSTALGVALLLPAATVVASCGLVSNPDETSKVCDERDRQVLLRQRLTRELPSEPFVVGEDGSTWVGLIADYDYSASALFSALANVRIVESGVLPDIRKEGDLQLVKSNDPKIRFDSEGDFKRIDQPPGDYQLWSASGPVITVVSCP